MALSAWILLGLMALLLSGCATPMTAYSTQAVKSEEAIVLVGVNSEVPSRRPATAMAAAPAAVR